MARMVWTGLCVLVCSGLVLTNPSDRSVHRVVYPTPEEQRIEYNAYMANKVYSDELIGGQGMPESATQPAAALLQLNEGSVTEPAAAGSLVVENDADVSDQSSTEKLNLVDAGVSGPPNQMPDGTPLYRNGYPLPLPPVVLQPGEVLVFDTTCPDHCSGHGECIDGKCLCEEGFLGEACAQTICPNNCTGKGVCHDGICSCRTGYGGVDCSMTMCPGPDGGCSGNGLCSIGVCYCKPEWEGDFCESPRYGLPNLTKPLEYGNIGFQRLNTTCVVARVPPRLTYAGTLPVTVTLNYTNNLTCISDLGPEWKELLDSSAYPRDGVVTDAWTGDTPIFDVVEGCSEAVLTVEYDNQMKQTITHPGGFVPPPPPKVWGPNEVELKYCANNCSFRGTCWNNTQPDSWAMKYECKCDAPWIVPCCCSQDRPDERPSPRDPLQDGPGDTPYNNVPCSKDDDCLGCNEAYVRSAWIPTALGTCTWNGNECGLQLSETDTDVVAVCRTPGLPTPDYYQAKENSTEAETPVVDPCTAQFVLMGQEACNNPGLCGDPDMCALCAYDQEDDRCYTPANNATAA